MLNEEELRKALDKYGDMVRRICFMYLKKEEDVEDVFQEVFLKYVSNQRSFTSTEHEKAWMIRVTINESKSVLRKWFHRKVELKEDLSIYGFENKPTYPEVLEAIVSLPPKWKDVIYLYYYEGYKIKEIATILKCKENTVHTWLRRARKRLHAMLGDEYIE